MERATRAFAHSKKQALCQTETLQDPRIRPAIGWDLREERTKVYRIQTVMRGELENGIEEEQQDDEDDFYS